MHSYYVLKLEDKNNLYKLYRSNVYFIKIKYIDNYCLLYVDDDNYLKLLKYFKIYNISLIKVYGLNKYKILIKKYYIFIISIIISLIMMYILSNIIFDIKIMSNNEEIIKILENELNEYGISKYHFIKNYQEKEEIKKKILKEFKDKLEWIEIDRIGTKYYIRVLERIINNENNINEYKHVVSKKNAVILEIKASSGEIVKKVNDYVNKGDIIISGNITKKDEIKSKVEAKGSVYGEVWYNVKVEFPRTYNLKKYTGNIYNRLTINIFDKKIFLFGKKKYSNEEYYDKPILSSNILPFSINKTKIMEYIDTKSIYTYDTILEKAMTLARDKLLISLSSDAKILSQKKLKLYEENNIIIVEVFFKVYENITDYKVINEEGE